MIATECNQPGAQNPERQPQQHHRVLHLCRRPPPRPAVAGRALMRGFLLDGHQGSAQAACQAGEGVTRAVQLAPERHAAAAVEGALLRPADWLAAMAVNPVQVSQGLCQGLGRSKNAKLQLLVACESLKVWAGPRGFHVNCIAQLQAAGGRSITFSGEPGSGVDACR